jgi:cytochrome c556
MLTRGVAMKRLLIIPAMWCLLSNPALAALKFVGSGEAVKVDTTGFPPEMKASYATMTSACTKCHSFERIALSYTSGVAPVTNQPFDLEFLKQHTYNMFRKSEARDFSVSKEDRKSIYTVLKYMLDESAR